MQSTPLPSSLTGDGDLSRRKHLVQQAQAQIDEEINALCLPVCALRTKRNALSPVSRLPDELLATVFIFYARQNHISEWAKVKNPTRVPLCVRVSYVCRHWRMVALGCPTLWTYVSRVSRTWMTVLLQRSQVAPLRVRIDLTYGRCRLLHLLPMLEILFEHLPRMEEFHIRGLSAGAVPNIISKLNVPAPRLQSLQLTVSSKWPLTSLDLSLPTLPVVFSRTTPKLRSLDLSRLDIAWNSLTLTGITSLRLSSVPRPHTMQQLSSILSQIPRLTDLELEDVLPQFSPHIQDPLTEKITLPCLSRLLIVASVPDTVHFLSYVHVPLNTEIRLKCVFEGHASLSQLLSYVQTRFSPHEDEREESTPRQPVRSMSIEYTPPQAFLVTCSTSEGGYKYRPLCLKTRISPHDYDRDRDIALKIDLQDRFSTVMTETVMVNIFQHLSLAHLQSLSVHFPDVVDLPSIFWRALFHLARELRFIKLRHTALRGFFTILPPDHRGWIPQNHTLTARALEEIELEEVSFATTCDPYVENGSYTCNPAFQCLCGALAQRKDAGYPLRRIKISDSSNVGTDEHVNELREVVSEVTWDGINTGSEDSAESP